MFAIAFPAIDPVAIEIGPFAIRWYALAYLTSFLIAWWYVRRLAVRPPQAMTAREVDDLMVWAILGVLLGGRLGYVLFYNPGYYLDHPLEIAFLWRGGMSFHGGLLGVVLALVLFVRRRKLVLLQVGDVVACAAPIGLFLGRIANFVNGELFGRASEVPWAMVFPAGGPISRHPSQLYEAALEGVVLFAVLLVMERWGGARAAPGRLTGAFLVGYAVVRAIGELFREPDAHIGYLVAGTTMGQLLSLPMLGFGLFLILRSRRRT